MFLWAGLGVLLIATYATYHLFLTLFNYAKATETARALNCKPIPNIPSLDPFFGIDVFIKLLKLDFQGRRSETFKALHKKYGTTFLAICTTSFDDWGVGPIRGSRGMPFLDRGIFTDDGELWKYSRSLIRPTFVRTDIADLTKFEGHVTRFLASIPREGTTFNLVPVVKKLFLYTSTEFLFGHSVEYLTSSISELDVFMKAFDRCILSLGLIAMLGPLRWLVYLDPGWKRAYKSVHLFIDKCVSRALEKEKVTENQNPKYILLDEMAKLTQDSYNLRMQILNVFIPARDTVANSFADLIFLLSRHPLEWGKLRAEVLDIDPQQLLTYEFLRTLKRTKAIINEAFRLYPAARRIVRVSLRDTVLPKGGGPDGQFPIYIPKGQIVEMDLYAMHRNPEIWGPDADEFKPDRWCQGRVLWEAKWQYEPFLGGIRMCPAQNQVLTQMAYLLVRFAQEFRSLGNRDEIDEYLEVVSLSIENKNGVSIAVESA